MNIQAELYSRVIKGHKLVPDIESLKDGVIKQEENEENTKPADKKGE
jgi:hypothetical protein